MRLFSPDEAAQGVVEHGFSENADFFGGYMCICDEASWNEAHARETDTPFWAAS